MEMTIEQLSKDYEKADKALKEGIKKILPLGTKIRVQMRHNARPIEAEIIWHPESWSNEPHRITVRNLKTGKKRRVSVHPKYGHPYEVIG